jgi:hypothetical protein
MSFEQMKSAAMRIKSIATSIEVCMEDMAKCKEFTTNLYGEISKAQELLDSREKELMAQLTLLQQFRVQSGKRKLEPLSEESAKIRKQEEHECDSMTGMH